MVVYSLARRTHNPFTMGCSEMAIGLTAYLWTVGRFLSDTGRTRNLHTKSRGQVWIPPPNSSANAELNNTFIMAEGWLLHMNTCKFRPMISKLWVALMTLLSSETLFLTINMPGCLYVAIPAHLQRVNNGVPLGSCRLCPAWPESSLPP